MPIFIPIIDLTYKGSIQLLKNKKPPWIVVRIMDVALKNSYKPNNIFYEIVNVGGLHAFLNYKGIIILSTVMPDEQIKKFYAKKYAFFINALLPNYYLTVDGWTYHKKFRESEKDLQRIMRQTKELLSLCPDSKALGLVKGCSVGQIEMHSSWLLAQGIKDLVLHVGDFRRNGNPFHIETARNFACIIRKKARTLLLYGFGSQKSLLSHSFADAYVSNNHFIATDNGMVYEGVNMREYSKRTFEEIMEKNYDQMQKNMNSLQYQTKLSEVNIARWEAVATEKEELALVVLAAQALAVAE